MHAAGSSVNITRPCIGKMTGVYIGAAQQRNVIPLLAVTKDRDVGSSSGLRCSGPPSHSDSVGACGELPADDCASSGMRKTE